MDKPTLLEAAVSTFKAVDAATEGEFQISHPNKLTVVKAVVSDGDGRRITRFVAQLLRSAEDNRPGENAEAIVAALNFLRRPDVRARFLEEPDK